MGTDIKTWDELIDIIKDKMVICPDFRDWEEEWQHIKPHTTELERFISWFKQKKLKEITDNR